MASSMTDKLHISNEMKQFDLKNREFFDSLDADEKKKFSPFIMIRWGASVEPNRALSKEENYFLQAYYLRSTNEKLNKHFFDINTTKHKKMQWLMSTTVSPGMGQQFHKWLAAKKKDTDNNKVEKFLAEVYPHLRSDEIKLMAKINDRDDIKSLAREHGWDEKRIKSDL
jgi:hypothetical protein